MSDNNIFRQHQACRWEEIGRCVYCAEHGDRLYQGSLPSDEDGKQALVDWMDKVLAQVGERSETE